MPLSNLPPGLKPWKIPGCTTEDARYDPMRERVIEDLKDDGEFDEYLDDNGQIREWMLENVILSRMEAEDERARYGDL